MISKGLFFAILAPVCYSFRAFFLKIAPPAQIEFYLFFRYATDFIFFIPFFILHFRELKPRRLFLLLGRSLLSLPALYLAIYGYRHLALVDAILLESTMPLFILLIVLMLKKRKATLSSFYPLLVGFIAVYLLLKPKLEIFHLATLASLSVGLIGASMCVLLHEVSKVNKTACILFYFYMVTLPMSAIPCAYTWQPIGDHSIWLYLLLMGVFGVLYNFSMTKAYSLAPPHIVGGFSYFGILASALLDWGIWGKVMGPTQLLGGFLLLVSGLLIVREDKKNNERESMASLAQSD